MKRILLVGSGAREHAILRAVKRSSQPSYVVCLAGHENPAILAQVDDMVVDKFDNRELLSALVETHQLTHAIIGPEAPLELGMADQLSYLGVDVLGPTKNLAQIETSKAYARELLKDVIPEALPKFVVVTDVSELPPLVEKLSLNIVIKGGGLMGGKGVYVSGDHFETSAEALDICQTLLQSNSQIVLEEKLEGEEFSLLSLCDGKTLKHFPVVQDNKRAFIDDKGPNTGGMGSISFENFGLPFISNKDVKAAQLLNEKAINALQVDVGEDYRGIIYGGYMLTTDGVKLIEFNARFGDPECINLLHLLESDLLDLLDAVSTQSLESTVLNFSAKASVCKYAVPNGYPTNSEKNAKIHFDIENPAIYSGHIKAADTGYEMLGSRALACLGVGDSIEAAEKDAQALIDAISGDFSYRADIGTAKLIQKRISHMRTLGYDC